MHQSKEYSDDKVAGNGWRSTCPKRTGRCVSAYANPYTLPHADTNDAYVLSGDFRVSSWSHQVPD